MRNFIVLISLVALGCSGESSTGSGGASGAGTGGTGGASGGTGGGTAGSGGTAACNTENCAFTCCGDQCVNTGNDIKNCGTCGNSCGESATPFCNAGTCEATPPCAGAPCIGTKFCCGTTCCDVGQLCCDVPGPVATGLICVAPINGTCPPGCKDCKCNAPDTPIATPSGERAIADLAPGDLVYSVHHAAIVAVPITKHQRVEASGHFVVELELANGRVLHVSAAHPTADGRKLGDLRPGDRLDGVAVLSSALVPLAQAHTVDILPASDTGTYFAGGVLLKSTIAGR